jgi:hypothetical protein
MSDASYVIDIAANMPAGEATSAQLDTLVQNLTGAGKGADFFQAAIKQLSGSLDAAKAASAAANASLAEGNAQYRQLEKAANVAAKAAERAALSGKLSPELSREAHQADSALQGYSRTLKTLEQNASAATKAEASFARQMANVQKLATHTDKTFQQNAEKLQKVTGALNNFGGPVGSVAAKVTGAAKSFEELSGAFGAANAAMLVGAAATVLAGMLASAAWAVGLADASRAAKLHGQAVAAMTPELDGLRGTFADLTKSTGLQNDQLEDLAAQLLAAKTPADRMAGALADAALQEAALGKGGASKFIANITASKGAVTGLANSTRLALGGVVAQQLRGIDAQSAGFKKNIATLFGGLDIEPVLRGLERLGGLFDQTTSAGQTIKFLFESVFQPLIDQADKAATVVEAFALGFLIGLTKVYIAIKPAIKAVSEFFGFKDTSLSDVLAIATKAGEYAAYVFVGFVAALSAVGAVIGVVVAACVGIQVAMYAVMAAAAGLAALLAGALVGAFAGVWTYLAGLGGQMVSFGADLVMGLVNGITGSAGAIVNAVTGAVGGAITSAKKLLGIASPSKVFAEIGGYTGEGFAAGVDDSAPQAQASMADMVDPAPVAAKAAGASAAGPRSSAPAVHIENLYLAGEKASEAETQSLSEALTRLIRGDAAALGGEAAPA